MDFMLFKSVNYFLIIFLYKCLTDRNYNLYIILIFLQMIAAITTYMVIFIQFMPKEETQLNDTTTINDLIETTTLETTALSVIT